MGKKKKLTILPRLLRTPTPSERVYAQAMYVTEYYTPVVMVIIHEDRLSVLLPFFFCLQENAASLWPHPSNRQAVWWGN